MIDVSTFQFEAEIFDTPTGKEFISKLPNESKTLKYGDLFYFKIPQMAPNLKLDKSAKKTYNDGDIVYWIEEKDVLICFGKVPPKDKMVQEGEEEETEENELIGKCNLFGKIVSNLENISKVDHDSTISIKFIPQENPSPPNVAQDLKKKRPIKLSDGNEAKKRRITRSGEGQVKQNSFSSLPILSIKYKYEGEVDADSKLIKMEIQESEVTSDDIKKYLIDDNVNFEELNEIRYFEYSSDEDSEGERFNFKIQRLGFDDRQFLNIH
jgi:hypothetical protein